MLRIFASGIFAVVVVSCSSGPSGTGVFADAGADAGDGGVPPPSLCTRQPESARADLCGATASNVLLACDEGAGPPSSECTKTTQANAYCCPAPATPNDAGADAAPGADNPYGVPYPSDNIGMTPRAGTKRGHRIANHAFQGYAPGSTALGPVSLANLYDPQGKTHDVVIIVGGALWDTYTGATLAPIKASTKRIATLAVLGEGVSAGKPATLADLSNFRTNNPWATTALDSGFTVLGGYFDAQAVPLVIFVDARTMEIASAGVGGITTVQDIDAAVMAITNRPASY